MCASVAAGDHDSDLDGVGRWPEWREGLPDFRLVLLGQQPPEGAVGRESGDDRLIPVDEGHPEADPGLNCRRNIQLVLQHLPVVAVRLSLGVDRPQELDGARVSPHAASVVHLADAALVGRADDQDGLCGHPVLHEPPEVPGGNVEGVGVGDGNPLTLPDLEHDDIVASDAAGVDLDPLHYIPLGTGTLLDFRVLISPLVGERTDKDSSENVLNKKL